MLSDTNQPMVGETLSFASEQQEVLASCITNASGRCTMILADVEADASGLIRGTLLTGRGQRPIIFKGELFEITLTLDETDQLNIPSDAYVTRTPDRSPQPKTTATTTTQVDTTATTTTQVDTTATTTTQVDTTATTTTQVDTTATTTAQPEMTATTTTQPEMTATTTTQQEATAPVALEKNNLYFWLQLGLIIILIAAAVIYFWASQKQDNP